MRLERRYRNFAERKNLAGQVCGARRRPIAEVAVLWSLSFGLRLTSDTHRERGELALCFLLQWTASKQQKIGPCD